MPAMKVFVIVIEKSFSEFFRTMIIIVMVSITIWLLVVHLVVSCLRRMAI